MSPSSFMNINEDGGKWSGNVYNITSHSNGMKVTLQINIA